jgi:2-polyprenyl-3-methyl-5-hydroxy-6-metoxy-1,4-benzoquinol methylase
VANGHPEKSGEGRRASAEREIEAGQRFEFGRNWSAYLEGLDEARIVEAERSMTTMLGRRDLSGARFLDLGCGSGLFSLAARRLGARVHSVDFDPRSVACAAELRRRYHPDDGGWTIEQGSVLDADYLASLGRFDIVYSWGVLHHTGDMWRAIDQVAKRVRAGGTLYISIYNDQGRRSRLWTAVKRTYNRRPLSRPLLLGGALLLLWGPITVRDAMRGRPFRSWRRYGQTRGMSAWRDLVDWVGGYPFAVAKPEAVFDFCRERGFSLVKLKTCAGGHGCNEFVFTNAAPPDS